MRGRRNQHLWTFMGRDKKTNVEYTFCPLCKKYGYFSRGGFTFIKKSEYMKRFNSNLIEGMS